MLSGMCVASCVSSLPLRDAGNQMTTFHTQDFKKTSSASCLDTWSVIAPRFSACHIIYNFQIGSNDSADVGCSDRGHTHHCLITVLFKTRQDVRDAQVALSFVDAYGSN